MDASYGTKDSDEMPSDSKLPRSYENVEDSELESLARSRNEPEDNNNQDEDETSIDESIGVSDNEEAGVDNIEMDHPADIGEQNWNGQQIRCR